MQAKKLSAGTNIPQWNSNAGLLNRVSQETLSLAEQISGLQISLGLNKLFKDLTFLDTYTNWTSVIDLSGYSIWKHAVTDFVDNDDNYLVASVVDTLENLYVPHIYGYKGAAASEQSTYFPYIFTYVGSTFSSNLGGAGGALTVGGSTELFSATKVLYIGAASVFGGFSLDLSTFGAGLSGNLVFEYYDGDSWEDITELMGFSDLSSNFTSSGSIYFDSSKLTDWGAVTVNSQSAYWIRVSATSGIRYPSANTLLYANSVKSVLTLSKTDLQELTFSWCYYNGYVYIPIPSAGASIREGVTWITSSSTTYALRTYFELYNRIGIRHYVNTTVGGLLVNADTDAASATNVGKLRYRVSGSNSYLEMVMQTDASEYEAWYEWVIIKQNTW